MDEAPCHKLHRYILFDSSKKKKEKKENVKKETLIFLNT